MAESTGGKGLQIFLYLIVISGILTVLSLLSGNLRVSIMMPQRSQDLLIDLPVNSSHVQDSINRKVSEGIPLGEADMEEDNNQHFKLEDEKLADAEPRTTDTTDSNLITTGKGEGKGFFSSTPAPQVLDIRSNTQKMMTDYNKNNKSSEASGCPHCCSQSFRVTAMNTYCKNHPDLHQFTGDPRNNRNPFRYILVSETHKVLLCVNMKAGSRLWADTLVRASSWFRHQLNESNPIIKSVYETEDVLKQAGIASLKHYTGDALNNVLENYFKVIVVRNPFDRIYSAYRDKFVYSPMGQGSIDCYKYVLKNYRKIPMPDISTDVSKSMMGQPKISLAEFVKLVTDKSSPYNIHWELYTNNCHPCRIHYDHVVRTETNNIDADRVLDILTNDIDPKILRHQMMTRDKDALKESLQNPTFSKSLAEFETVPKEDLDKLVSYLKPDMDMFGYQFDTSTKTATCSLVNHTTMSVCC